MPNSGGFFAIDRRIWAGVCNTKLEPAVAYLVLARGTGRDNKTSWWSANAIERYTSIPRGHSKNAIGALVRNGFVEVGGKKRSPLYKLRSWAEWVKATGDRRVRDEDREPDPVWLPNELVTGASAEIPPVELVRQAQDVMILRLLVDLYYSHNLVADGGIDRSCIQQEYERKILGEWQEYRVWGFVEGSKSACPVKPAECHWRDELTPEQIERGENKATDFYSRFHHLERIGLVQWVPHLVESDRCERDQDGNGMAGIIHPLGLGDSDEIEDRLAFEARIAGEEMLTETGRAIFERVEHDLLVPVVAHKPLVQVVGIARLRYRPKTSMTKAWWAELLDKGERYISAYRALAQYAANPALERASHWPS